MTSADKLQFTTAEIRALMSNDATTHHVISALCKLELRTGQSSHMNSIFVLVYNQEVTFLSHWPLTNLMSHP